MPVTATHQPGLRTAERALLGAVAQRPANRRELIQTTGLSRTTVITTVADLINRGLLVEDDEFSGGPRRVGRPAARLSLAQPAEPLALIRLRRGSTTIALIDHRGDVSREGSLDLDPAAPITDLAHSVQGQLASWGTAINAAILSVPLPYRSGVGVHPIRDVSAEMRGQLCLEYRLPSWLSTDFAAELTRQLSLPVLAENDANLAALGEATHGAGQGKPTVISLSIKDGIGSGIVFNEQLHRGASGVAGELAHVSVNELGVLCLCGNRGCICTLWEGPVLTNSVTRAYGHNVSFEDMQHLAQRGDSAVVRILGDLGRQLGEALAPVVTLMNPDVLVVDGALGTAAPPVISGLNEAISRHTPSMVRDALQVVPGALGASADVFGATVLGRASRLAALASG